DDVDATTGQTIGHLTATFAYDKKTDGSGLDDPTRGHISYTYTLVHNTTGTPTNPNTVSVFPVTITTITGTANSQPLQITIQDDTPVAAADSNNLASGQFTLH